MEFFSQIPSGFRGSQLTALHNNVEEKLELFSSFFKEGLEKSEYCVWIISGSLDCEKVKAELKKAGLDIGQFRLPGQLEIIHINQLKLKEEALSSNVGKLLEVKYEYAVSKGFSSLRAGIDLQIPANDNPLSFIHEYKRNLDFFVHENRVFVLSTCPLKAFSTSEVLDLLEENQYTIIKRKGNWTAPRMLSDERAGGSFPISPVHDKQASEKWTYESLKSPEDIFKNIFDNMEEVVAVCDLDCRILKANKKACERLGYSRDEFLLMPVWKLETLEYQAMFEGHRKLVMEFGRASFEVNIICRDGAVVPYEIIAKVMDYEGELFILAIGRDISEKKAVFETLKKSEEKLRNIFDNSNDSIIIHDMEGRILEVNRICCERMGYSYDEILRLSLEDIKGPAVQKNVREEIEKFKKYGYVVMEIESLCKDGSTFPNEISNRVINYDGKPAVISIGRDITEQKRARRELEKSEERYRTITRMTKLLLYSYNFENGEIELLGAIPEITGYSFDEFQNVNVEAWLNMIHPEDREHVVDVHEKCFLEGGDFHEEYRLRQKNGNYIYVEDSGVYLKNKSNQVFRAAGAVKNITDKKLAARILEKSEEKFRIAAEQTGQIIFDYDAATNSFDWAGAIEELTGYGPEEFREFSIDLWKDIHPDDMEKFVQEYETAWKSANRYRGEHRFRRKDGRYFYAEDSGIILRDAAGEPRRIIGAIKDITPIKVTSEKLMESEARYRSFLQNFAGIAFQVDKEFKTFFSQGRAEEITGYSEDDFTSGKISWQDLVDPRDMEKLHRDEKFLQENPKSTLEKEYRIIRKDGEIRWIHDILHCIHDDQGNVLYYQGYLYDITEKKNAEEAILHAKIESEVAKNTKTDFVINMSHELRTPLNSIIGFSDILLLELFGNLNPKQLKHVKNISISAKHLLDLINNLLDLSKIEAGKSEIYYEEISVPDMIAEVIEVISQKAREKNIVLETRVATEVEMIRADRVKFKQILYNLLSNSIKFTPAGGAVTVTATCRENGLEVSVTDTGIGISADKIEIIFHPFVQADTSTSREFGGTGLGLTLVKKFVEMQGGKVRVNSEPGKGSTFTFTLPGNEESIIY